MLALGPKHQVLRTKEIYGQRAGDKTQRQEIEDKKEREENKGEGKGVFALEGQRTTYCLWIERTQTRPRGKWWFLKLKGEIQC